MEGLGGGGGVRLYGQPRSGEGGGCGDDPFRKSPSHLLSPGPAPALVASLLLVHQLLRMFFRQQDEIRRLKEELAQKDIRIRQLQLELKNLRNSPKNC